MIKAKIKIKDNPHGIYLNRAYMVTSSEAYGLKFMVTRFKDSETCYFKYVECDETKEYLKRISRQPDFVREESCPINIITKEIKVGFYKLCEDD